MPALKDIVPYGHMLQNHYLARVRALSEARREARAGITTPEQARKLVRNVRRRIQGCFGALPERTPLRARVTGRLERDGYRIEKILFESRPRFPVSANLYLPADAGRGKLPGIIGACGHAAEGKAAIPYQAFCRGLAVKGFAVLIYDPLGQGERKQFADLEYPGFVDGPCSEHNMLGNAMRLCDDFLGSWRAWDGIRALDYLLSRPEIDPARVGVTGNSGGGTLTSYLNALDSRFTMAAPSCFVTTFLRNIENELPADSEQNPPGFLAAGLDMADFFIARAPRPTLLLGQANDFFDARGVEETSREIRRIYRLLGAENNIAHFIGPDSHGFHRANREAMYGFFLARAGITADRRETEFVPEKEETLHCTESGQVVGEPRSCRRVFEFTARAARNLRRQRGRRNPADLPGRVSRRLAVKPVRKVPGYRVLRPDAGPLPGQLLSRFAVETQPGILALLFRPTEEPLFSLPGSGPVRLWVPHLGSRRDWIEGRVPATEPGETRFALDPRGRGESRPISCGLEEDIFFPYGSDFFYACGGEFLNEPWLGGAVRDVLSVVRLLRARGFGKIHLEGRGMGAITAAFSAVLAGEQVDTLRLFNPLLSYHELTQKAFYRWPLSVLPPAILKDLDLPDLYRALAGRLELIDPWNADMQPLDEPAARSLARRCGIPARRLRFVEK